MRIYAILNTENKKLFCADTSRKWVYSEFKAYHENGDHYKFITITNSEIVTLETCRRLGSIIDKRLLTSYPSVNAGHFIEKAVIKSLSEKCLIDPDGDFWRINTYGSGVLFHVRGNDDYEDSHGVTPGDRRHINVR